jgi:hypothetical protein
MPNTEYPITWIFHNMDFPDSDRQVGGNSFNGYLDMQLEVPLLFLFLPNRS